MSLQVWMPLNGNINNQGLSEISPAGTPKYYTNGKMSSQCLDMSSAITGTASGLTGATEWSAAFWYKIDNNDSLSADWVDTLLLQDQTEDNSTIGGFRFETCYSSSASASNKGLHWHDNTTNATVTDWALVSADREVWHHACITVSPTKGIYTYCDGTLVHTSSKSHNGGHLTGYFKIGNSNLISGGIQDIRLYNHALSAKEVAEIAKGLILHYKLDYMGFDKTEEPDCSGFGNNGTMVGAFTYDSDTPRYSSSTVFNGTDTYIAAGTGAKVKDAITVSIWAYMDDWHNDGDVNKIRPISCTQLGGWVIEGKTNGKIAFSVYTGTDSNAYKVAYSTMTRASMASGWHHFVGTYDGFNVKFYIDGVLQTTNAAYTTKTPIYYNSSNGIFIGDEAAGSATTPESSSTHNFNGKISDVRIYATALTPDQVKELYNSPCSIDNSSNLFCYQIEERSKTSISKYGIWYDKCFSGSIVNQYDPITYVEPDGSIWIRIFHHNAPTNNGIFSSTDSFATSVYLDDNRWFNVSLCNYLSSNWELMIKQKLLDTNNETKYRWIQNYNPMTATYEQVTVDNVTKVTTNGYSTNTAYGGLHKHSAATYICASNASSTQWFGAVGCYALYNSGIAAYGGGAITTGYMDLYLRVDNIETPNFRINAGGTMATDFYEI